MVHPQLCSVLLLCSCLAVLCAALGLEVGSFMAPFNLLSLHMWLIINRLHQVRLGFEAVGAVGCRTGVEGSVLSQTHQGYMGYVALCRLNRVATEVLLAVWCTCLHYTLRCSTVQYGLIWYTGHHMVPA